MGEVINFAGAIHARRVAAIISEREAAAARRAGEVRAALRADYARAGRSGEMFADILADVLEAKAAEEKAASAPAYVPAYCDPDNDRRGTKYEATRGLGSADIAARIRADIKAAQKAGTVPPGLKISVRKHSYSGGYSIDVRVTALPPSFTIYNPDYLRHEKEHERGAFVPFYGDRLSPEWKAAKAALEALHGAYNRDNSDSMSDYFDVRYYGDVGLHWELERDVRKAELGAALSIEGGR